MVDDPKLQALMHEIENLNLHANTLLLSFQALARAVKRLYDIVEPSETPEEKKTLLDFIAVGQYEKEATQWAKAIESMGLKTRAEMRQANE